MIVRSERPDDVTPAPNGGEERASGQAEFLGEEFLTWLWWQIEVHGGNFELEPFGTVGVAFDRLMEFRGDASNTRLTVRADAVSRTPEAHAALATGKHLTRARLVIGWHDLNVEVTVDGASLDLLSLSVPRPRADDRREEDEEAAALLETVAGLVTGLYGLFVRQRLAAGFREDTLNAMRRWVGQRGPHPAAPVRLPAGD